MEFEEKQERKKVNSSYTWYKVEWEEIVTIHHVVSHMIMVLFTIEVASRIDDFCERGFHPIITVLSPWITAQSSIFLHPGIGTDKGHLFCYFTEDAWYYEQLCRSEPITFSTT